MDRRSFLKQSGAVVAATALQKTMPAKSEGQSERPLNLLFITADDMNWSLPGFMGGKYELTPHLDDLAKRSHKFVHNRTVAAICQPSREAMMTGLLPHHSGGLGFVPINPGTPTLTTILQEHGYFTAGIHKLSHMQPDSCFPWDFHVHGHDRNPLVYEESVQQAMSLARAAKKPFFINCNINDPHRPFYGSPQAAVLDHNEEGPYKIQRVLTENDVEAPSLLENLPPIREEFAQYCNSVHRLDISIGKVLAVLRDSPEADHTVVVFSSDHGMPFPFAKATCYNYGSRTPALISWPGMGSPRTFEDLTQNIDYLPTILDVLGVPVPEHLDGRSWMPLIEGRSRPRTGEVVTYINSVFGGAEFPVRAIQNMRYSLIASFWANGERKFRVESMEGLTFPAMVEAGKTDARIAARVRQYVYGIPLAFYDLEHDPDQRVNVIDVPEYKGRVAEMKQHLLETMEATDDPQLGNYKKLLKGEKPIVVQPQRHV
ncbi:MAG: sulfatase-like hydrolase/transferase [Acidobacteriaceae bacterium]